MGNLYAKEKQFRSIIEKLIISSDKIDSVDRLYEEIFGSTNAEEIQLLAEKIAIFFQDAETLYGHSLLKFNNDTFIYQVNEQYRQDLIQITQVIDHITAGDFEKLCALFLKEIVGCEEVNATQCSHDQGIDFVGYKKYVPCLTANEQNSNLLYVIGQAKHYKNECVEVSEIRELAGAIYLLKTNDFSKKTAQIGERVIYRNLVIDAFTPIIPYFITSNYFTSYAYILCKNAAIIAIDRLELVLNFLFSNRFRGMSQNEILQEIQEVDRIS